MKRMAFAAIAALLISCQSVDTAEAAGSLKHRVLSKGDFAAMRDSRRQVAYAATKRAYESLWNRVVGKGDPPAVDFTKEGVVFIVAGERPTGGYAITVKKITRKKATLVVDAPVTGPPGDAMVIQALTSPFLVIAIPKTNNVSKVHWENAANIVDQPAVK